MSTKIYALIDPRDGEIRFVGRCKTSIVERVSRLVSKANGIKDHDSLTLWIRELLPEGPKFSFLEEALDVPLSVQKKWIKKFKSEGKQLLNEEGKTTANRVALPDGIQEQMGKVSDGKIAEQLGCTARAVAYRRARLGITAAHDWSAVRKSNLVTAARKRRQA